MRDELDCGHEQATHCPAACKTWVTDMVHVELGRRLSLWALTRAVKRVILFSNFPGSNFPQNKDPLCRKVRPYLSSGLRIFSLLWLFNSILVKIHNWWVKVHHFTLLIERNSRTTEVYNFKNGTGANL